MNKDLHNVIITCMAFFNFDNNNDNDNYYNNNKIIKIILSFSLPVNLKIFCLDFVEDELYFFAQVLTVRCAV